MLNDAEGKMEERFDTLDCREDNNIICSVDGKRTNWRLSKGEEKAIKVLAERKSYGYFTKERRDGEFRCYSCGIEGRMLRECGQIIQIQIRCYNCGSFGHGVRSCLKLHTENPLN